MHVCVIMISLSTEAADARNYIFWVEDHFIEFSGFFENFRPVLVVPLGEFSCIDQIYEDNQHCDFCMQKTYPIVNSDTAKKIYIFVICVFEYKVFNVSVKIMHMMTYEKSD